ncbi:unnamed protein product [Heligmosomoides polygyrus]|uniref:Sod_Cu domain-containing protein n=1 Tax=Heligmosomoides polygyrus TaxID=6339 RepID=A0A183G3V0_HELPZ|nr:unnamed protein product [Heligmosomoides polygyrus]
MSDGQSNGIVIGKVKTTADRGGHHDGGAQFSTSNIHPEMGGELSVGGSVLACVLRPSCSS